MTNEDYPSAEAEYAAEAQNQTPPPVASTQAVTVRDAVGAVERAAAPAEATPRVTAAQAKIEAVANLTAAAYSKASELKLTPEESAALQADFPDEAFKPGAAGKESLIYIEHAFLRDRLNSVIGIGQWALIPRSRWGEDFSYQRQQNGRWTTVNGTRIYVEAMLMVRGCFVAEAVGEMEYYPKNAGANYGDAVEGAKTAALRRCCKEFGVGLQAWKKDWCDGWWQRRRAAESNKPPIAHPRNQQQKPPAQAPAAPATQAAATAPAAQQKAAEPLCAKPAHLERMLRLLEQQFGNGVVEDFFQKAGVIMPMEGVEDVTLDCVPVTKDQMDKLIQAVGGFAEGSVEAKLPYPRNPVPPLEKAKPDMINVGAKREVTVPRDDETHGDANDPDSPIAAWRSFKMPFGANKGVELAELEKRYLFGLWANFAVETEYQGKPKKPETIARDAEFRRMLDDAGKHYNFEKKD